MRVYILIVLYLVWPSLHLLLSLLSDSEIFHRSFFIHLYNLQQAFIALRIFFWTLRKIQAIHNADAANSCQSTHLVGPADISIAKEWSKVRQGCPLYCKVVSFCCLHGKCIWMRGALNKERGKYTEIKLMYNRKPEHRPLFLSLLWPSLWHFLITPNSPRSDLSPTLTGIWIILME